MKKYLIILLLPALAFAQKLTITSEPSFSYRNYLIQEEGYQRCVYEDTNGNKTIGIGHKLKSNEHFILLADKQVNQLFDADLEIALASAKQLVPSFDKQPVEVKLVIVSMVFNLGHNGFYKFKNFREALAKRNYIEAQNEIRNSKWAKQLPNRAERAISLLTRVK